MSDKAGVNLVTQDDLRLIARKLNSVKYAGYGKVIIHVSDGKIVYISQEIGEQVLMKLDTDN